VVGFPIMALATAGVFLLVFRLVFSAELSFRQAFAIVCYSWVPLLFGSIMALAVMLLKNPEEFDLQYPTLTNIGAFLEPASTPKWLLSLGTSIDIFTIWTLILLATGFAAAVRKISLGSSFAGVMGTWAVYVLVKMGWAAAFG
jgi:Yip1 domain